VKVFHYLFEQQPGVVTAVCLGAKSISFELPVRKGGSEQIQLPFDERDQRTLVVFDGELLWDCIPKSGDPIVSMKISTLHTPVEHLRTARFGEASYSIVDIAGRKHAKLALFRHALLLPCGNFVVRCFRDIRSFEPKYVLGEVKKVHGEPPGHLAFQLLLGRGEITKAGNTLPAFLFQVSAVLFLYEIPCDHHISGDHQAVCERLYFRPGAGEEACEREIL